MWPGEKEVKVTYCQRECRGGKQVKMNSSTVKGNRLIKGISIMKKKSF